MRLAVPLPAAVEDIDAAWLTAALRSTGAADGEVVELQASRIALEQGFLGDLVRLTPVWTAGTGPASVIVKLPASAPSHRMIATALGMYRREVHFYRELAGRARIGHARCYYADLDEATQEFVLVLSDLGPAREADQVAGCSRADAELVVERLADLHASFWEDPALAGPHSDWLGTVADADFCGAIGGAFDAYWPASQDLFRAQLTPDLVAFGDRYSALLPEIAARLSEAPFTLCHGDCRLDNVFFYDDRADLALCDFQLISRGRGARDVAYFLTQSLAPDVRGAVEPALLERYVARLAAQGVTGYDSGMAGTDYRLASCLCFAYPVIAGATLLDGSARARQLGVVMFERAARAVADADVGTLFG